MRRCLRVRTAARLRLVLFVAGAMIWVQVLAAQAGEIDQKASLPGILRTEIPQGGDAMPLWVSANAALDASGQPLDEFIAMGANNSEGYALGAAHSYQRQLTAEELVAVAEDPKVVERLSCPEKRVLMRHQLELGTFVPGDDLETLASYAREVLLLRVEDTDPGFVYGVPQTMVRARVDQVLRDQVDIHAGTDLAVAYRYAKFVVGETLWCNIDHQYNLRPQPGDYLLFFSMIGPELLEPGDYEAYVPQHPAGMVLVKTNGRVIWPTLLREKELARTKPLSSLDELVDATISVIKDHPMPLELPEGGGGR